MPQQAACIGPGTHLGPYRIVAPLGAGGMGQVFVALDTKLDRKVAVKVIPPAMVGDPSLAIRFEREAKALAALNHPNILSIHDFGLEGDTYYSVTELLEGETLRSRLASGALDTASALRVAREIAEGLSAAHAKGVVHRDLKPANVFLTEGGRVKILDFGLARHEPATLGIDGPLSEAPTRDRSTRPGTILGTVGYMSPEQARGQPTDARTDIFALGVILYEMLTGARPFAGNSDVDVLAAILREPPTPIARKGLRIPPEVERLTLRCLEKDPASRFQSAGEVAVAIEGASSGFPSRFSLPLPRWRLAPRPALIMVAIVLSVAALLVLSMTAISRRHKLPPFEPRQITNRPGVEGFSSVSPDGTSVAYLAGEGDRRDVWVADLRGGAPIQLTSDGRASERPAWFPNGSSLLFGADQDGRTNVWKVPRFGGAPAMVIPDAREPAISPDGSRVAFSRSEGGANFRIWVASLGEKISVRRLTGDQDGTWDHRHPAWSPDGRSICYEDQNDLWVISSEGGPARRLTGDDAPDKDPVWSTDGRSVYFDSLRNGPWAIWRMASSGGSPERVTLGTGSERFPSLSADGRSLVYATTGRWLCTLVDRVAGIRQSLPAGYMATEPVFSPDGTAVSFSSDREGGTNLWTISLRQGIPEGEPRRLTQNLGMCANIAYSPDGRWIAYHRVLMGRRDVWVIPVSGGPPTPFTDGPSINVQPEWVPDGGRISFVSDRGGGYEVWDAPFKEGARGGEPRRLTHSGGQVWNHCWSADGETLAYVASDSTNADVWIAPDGGTGAAKRLTTNAGVRLVVWDKAGGTLLALGAWGGRSLTVRSLGQDGRWTTPAFAVASGPSNEIQEIEASPDGRLFVITEQENEGDIWVLEAKKGKF